MDLHSKMTIYITSTMSSPITKTAKTSKWLRLKPWQNWQLKAAEDPKLGVALLSKEHTLYLSFLGPNNPPLSSPKFGPCL